MKTLLALLIACLALTLAACGGDGDDDEGGGATGGGTAAPSEEREPSTPPANKGGGEKVDIPSISFDPEDVTVKAGTTITWTNSDDLPHTVTKTEGPGPEFDSGNIDPGNEYEQTFNAKGEIAYVCTIHPGQDGTITVE